MLVVNPPFVSEIPRTWWHCSWFGMASVCVSFILKNSVFPKNKRNLYQKIFLLISFKILKFWSCWFKLDIKAYLFPGYFWKKGLRISKIMGSHGQSCHSRRQKRVLIWKLMSFQEQSFYCRSLYGSWKCIKCFKTSNSNRKDFSEFF